MTQYEYPISPTAVEAINSFYENVSKKWKHTYALEDVLRYVQETINHIHQIGMVFPRIPTIARWRDRGYSMAHIDKWYYAYYIEDGIIYVEDACHQQNMHD